MVLNWHLLSSSISMSKLKLWAERGDTFLCSLEMSMSTELRSHRTQDPGHWLSSDVSVKVQTVGYEIMQEIFFGKILSIQIKCWLTVITVFNFIVQRDNKLCNARRPAPRASALGWGDICKYCELWLAGSITWPHGELWLADDYNRQDAVSVAVPGSIASQRGFSSIHRENSEEK